MLPVLHTHKQLVEACRWWDDGKCGDMYTLNGEPITRCIGKTYVYLQVAVIRLKYGFLLEKNIQTEYLQVIVGYFKVQKHNMWKYLQSITAATCIHIIHNINLNLCLSQNQNFFKQYVD